MADTPGSSAVVRTSMTKRTSLGNSVMIQSTLKSKEGSVNAILFGQVTIYRSSFSSSNNNEGGSCTQDSATPYTVHPRSKFMGGWNCVNGENQIIVCVWKTEFHFVVFLAAIFIIICAFFLPFQLAFGYEYSIYGTFDGVFWAVLWPIMDFYFFIDLLLNFRLCYYDDGELEDNPSMIFTHYLKTWFAIDFVSVSASVLEVVASGLGIARSVKIIKLLKLLKLLRVARLQKLIDELGDVAHEAKILIRLTKLFISVLGFAHVIGTYITHHPKDSSLISTLFYSFHV